jgi:hypothetical protein
MGRWGEPSSEAWPLFSGVEEWDIVIATTR